MKIGFIGCGNMGEAFLRGVMGSGLLSAADIYVFDQLKDAAVAKTYGVNVCGSGPEVAEKADAVFLAVKPNIYPYVIEEAKEALAPKLIVTMAPGVTLGTMAERMLPHKGVRVIRTMPNLPLMIGEGCIAYTFGAEVTAAEKAFFTELFGKIGVSIEIKEELYDAVTGASGSSPAFVFVFIEALADAAVAAGLARADAYRLVSQTVAGSAKMLLATGKHPGEWKDAVCSPGGTTIEGIMKLEENGFRGAITKAAIATIEKTKKMGEKK